MTTANQMLANARNAQKSTGPRTKEGKKKAKYNALKHGLRCDLDVIPGESPEQWEAELQQWQATWHPQDVTTMRLVEKAARCSWRLARAFRAENAHISKIAYEAGLAFDIKQKRQVYNAKQALELGSPAMRDKFNMSYATMDALVREWKELYDISHDLSAWNSFLKHNMRLKQLLKNTVPVWIITSGEILELSERLILSQEQMRTQHFTD